VRKVKIGSFQMFIPNAEENVGDFSSHLFSTTEVHKIGILDIRYLNLDRNDSNLLVVRRNEKLHLIPIDHGLCFPSHFEVAWCDWVWFDYPQTILPFDEECKQWVMNLNISQDLWILKHTFGMDQQALRIFYCMSTLLQKAVSRGLNLRDIASVIVRTKDLNEPSSMEKTISRANELAGLMTMNTRRKSQSFHEDPDLLLHRSSSFDGTIPRKLTSSDDIFFSFIDRLLDDVCEEILFKKSLSTPLTCSLENQWFDPSKRMSPSELTKMASPRLGPKQMASSAKVVGSGQEMFATLSEFMLQ